MKIIDDVKSLMEKQDEPKKKVTATVKPKKILIVEDEKPLADVLGEAFRHEGFETMHAENGKVGLAKALTYKPNLIILDLLMPVMDGKAMLRKLRAMPEFKKLPVVVLTNAGEVENIRETQFYNNAIEFLIKSNVSIETIVRKVKQLIW